MSVVRCRSANTTSDDGPAFAAGIAEGHLITRVGSQDIDGIDDLHDALDAATPGEPLAVTVLRGAGELELTVTIPEG